MPPDHAAPPPVLGRPQEAAEAEGLRHAPLAARATGPFATLIDMARAADVVFLVTATDKRFPLTVSGVPVTDTVVVFKQALKGERLVGRTLSDDGTLKIRQDSLTPPLEADRRYVVYLDLDDERLFEPVYPRGLYGEVNFDIANGPWENLFPAAGGPRTLLFRDLKATTQMASLSRVSR